MDYKEAYFKLQGELADLVEYIQKIQQKYEEKYISESNDSNDE